MKPVSRWTTAHFLAARFLAAGCVGAMGLPVPASAAESSALAPQPSLMPLLEGEALALATIYAQV